MKKVIEKLQSEKGVGLVSISLNTHKSYPDYEQDEIALKNILKEVKEELDKKTNSMYSRVTLNTLSNVVSEIDFTRLSNSLHLFVSTETVKVILSSQSLIQNSVFIGEQFKTDILEQEEQLAKDYYILQLNKEDARLYKARNESIETQILEFGFPFEPLEREYQVDKSDQKKLDNYVREFYNKVDKAVVKAFLNEKRDVVVISTTDNFSKLKQVADRPEIYQAHANINYNKTTLHELGKTAFQGL